MTSFLEYVHNPCNNELLHTKKILKHSATYSNIVFLLLTSWNQKYPIISLKIIKDFND